MATRLGLEDPTDFRIKRRAENEARKAETVRMVGAARWPSMRYRGIGTSTSTLLAALASALSGVRTEVVYDTSTLAKHFQNIARDWMAAMGVKHKDVPLLTRGIKREEIHTPPWPWVPRDDGVARFYDHYDSRLD